MPILLLENLIHRTGLLPRFVSGDIPAQQLLRIATPEDLHQELQRCSCAAIPGAGFPIRKKYAYLFVITTGSGEGYGCNENSDYMPELDGKIVTITRPRIRTEKTIKLGKGLASTHSTFKILGAVYRHHKTEPEHGVKRSGEIVWERWNPTMHRGEVIVELPEDKWSDELTAYDKGTPLMWSQGNGVPLDVCSRCGFEFKPKMKPEDRCECIRRRKLCFDESGKQIVLYCTDCMFYDISYVGNNPAAKIAAALLRVASSEPKQTALARTRVNHYSSSDVLRAMLDAESSTDPGEVSGIRICCACDPAKDAEFVKEAKQLDSDKLLSALHRLTIVLTPSQFLRIFMSSAGEPAGVSGFLDALPGAVARAVAKDPGIGEDPSWCPAESPDPSAIRKLERFVPDLGCEPVVRRKILIVRSAESAWSRASSPTEDGLKLADEYVRYLHTCLTSFAGPSAARRYVGMMKAKL